MKTLGNLFKLLFDVCIRLQLELPARVGPVHQKEPLLGVHLLHQDGRFFVVSCLFTKTNKNSMYNPLTIFTVRSEQPI